MRSLKREELVAQQVLEEKIRGSKSADRVGQRARLLAYDEVNDSLPAEVHSSERNRRFTHTFERNGIEIYERPGVREAARAVELSWKAPSATRTKDDAHSMRKQRPGFDAGFAGKNQRPLACILREMGKVPLLTREGEVTIAKRIERGNSS